MPGIAGSADHVFSGQQKAQVRRTTIVEMRFGLVAPLLIAAVLFPIITLYSRIFVAGRTLGLPTTVSTRWTHFRLSRSRSLRIEPSVAPKIDRLRRKGEAGPALIHDVHDLQEDLFAHAQEFRVFRCLDVGE